MARKKQEIALQKELNSQEEWDETMGKEGLFIIDVYQEWCGPCKSIVSLFRRLKNESGEDLLQFSVAKADNIDTLARYRGNCMPCFLFYGSGTLVDVVRGVNPPVLEKKIKEHLTNELNVLKGEPGAERVEIRDPAFKELDDAERRAKEKAHEEEEEREREVTIVLIKPDAKEKVDEIRQKLEERGIEILEQQERQLTEEEARDFYRHLEDQEWFEQMISYMTKDASTVLVITKDNEGIISEFREILGPANVEEAKETQPDSLRAIFGSESYMNALHAPDSGEKALQELHMFFPEFRIPTYKVPKAKQQERMEVEKTVALIRPDAFQEFREEILAKVKEAGFAIAMQKEVQLSRERAEQFYSEKKDNPFYEELINRMTNGPMLALALAREDAVKEWRKNLGERDPKEAKTANPRSLRALYSKEDIEINLLHGSDSSESAMKELEFFFPTQQTIMVIKPDAYENREEIVQKITEADFAIAARKELTMSEEMVRELYSNHAEKEYFNDLIAQMTSGTSVCLAVSRHDAIGGWREMMGETDPAKATEEHPDTIRAIFGKDLMHNAVHGSSNEDSAQTEIRLIFGDIRFDERGRRVPGTGNVPDEPDQDEEEGDFVGPNGEIVRTDPQAAEEEGEGSGEKPPADEPQAAEESADKAEGEQSADDRAASAEPAAEAEPQGGDQPQGEPQEGEKPEGEAQEPEQRGEEAQEHQEESDKQEAEQQDAKEEGQQQAGEQQASEQPASEEPAGEQPASEQPASEQPAGEQPAGEQQASEQPAGEQQASEQPAGEQQASEQPAGEQQASEQPAGEQQASEQPAGEQQASATETAEAPQEDGEKESGAAAPGAAP